MVLKAVDTIGRYSPNFRLLRWLKSRGARIMGTENYDLLQRHEQASYDGDLELALSTLEERDQYVVSRINETLVEGETGILFMGRYHNVGSRLISNMNVISFGQAIVSGI